jgi:GNAT superfamily N-acetyltransferase
VALHDYVRENVRFGFNKYFDASAPDDTLACGVGHCNPKSRLLVALFRAAGLESHQHVVVIPKEILKRVIPPSRYWMIPADGSCWLGGVLIDQAYQGQGYGREAVRAAITKLSEDDGYEDFALSYSLSNTVAKHLYETLGFVETDEREGNEIVARLSVDALM